MPISRVIKAGAPQYVLSFNDSAFVNCGSDASLDDLHDPLFTVELWIKFGYTVGGTDHFFPLVHKGIDNSVGWAFQYLDISNFTYGVRMTVFCATTNASAYYRPSADYLIDGDWHHLVVVFDDAGDRTPHIAVDGEWITPSASTAGVGAVVSGAAYDLIIGDRVGTGSSAPDGLIAWARISNNDRYDAATPTNFTPPAKDVPPEIDANTVEQWNFNEGSGSNTAAEVSSPTNDGTITDCTWVKL